MQHRPAMRVLTLIAGLAIATAASAYAQDTTETGAVPLDTSATTGGAIDTSEVDTSASDTTDTSAVQNPSGYRGLERDTTMFPADSGDSASQGQSTGTYGDTGAVDHSAAGHDSAHVGDTEPKQEEAATPRIDTSESSAAGDTAAVVDSTQ